MPLKRLQFLLSSVFFILGGWCLVLPQSVQDLCFRPEFRSSAPVVPLLIACFGAQAVLAGVFAAFSRFTRLTFLVYGVALIPFFVGDFYFYFARPILTGVGMADLAGNIVMLAICVIAWRSQDGDAAAV